MESCRFLPFLTLFYDLEHSNPTNPSLERPMTSHRDTGFFTETLASHTTPSFFASVTAELGRQRHEIELIASENIVSRAVMEAQGFGDDQQIRQKAIPASGITAGASGWTLPNLAIERACKLFGCGFANVQPVATRPSKVFQALIQPGDTILGMSLDAGSHLTHGAAPNQSGKWFKAVQYGVRKQD